MRVRSKTFDLIAVLLILVLSTALARQFLRPGDPVSAFKADLQACMTQFCENPNSEIELQGQAASLDANLRLRIPSERVATRQNWPFQFVRFVATRHAGLSLNRLRVTDLNTRQELTEWSGGPPASGPSHGHAFESQFYFETARSEVLRRGAQAQLDALAGPGTTLLLVDASSTSSLSPGDRALAPPAYFPSKNTPAQGKPFIPKNERAPHGGDVVGSFTVTKIDALLVLQGAAAHKREQLEAAAKSALGLNFERLGRVRVITL